MIGILRPLFEIVFPRSLERTAGRIGTLCAALALCVAFLFPAAARAGTEVASARWITSGALALAWVLLTWGGGRLGTVAAAVAALAIGSFLAPAPWLLLTAGGACLWAATALIPRAEWIPPVEDRDPPAEGTQELVESLAMALVLALVVREFGFEAFKIPTGSMEPTILGDLNGGRGRKGDRLLAFKPVEYRRWDITVFKFPLFRNTNYIKRMIGLPGEHLELREGDVYVNGRIVPKPDDVQELMWRKVFAPAPDADWVADFDPDDQGAWKLRKGFAEVEAHGDLPAYAQARFGFEEDLRATVSAEQVEAAAGGQFLISLEGGGRRCDLAIGADGAHVTGPGLDVRVPEVSLAALGPKFHIAFAMSDRVARLWVDGRQVGAWEHEDHENGGLASGRLRIGAQNLRAVVREVVGENDLQYDTSGQQTFDIPSKANGDAYDGYVMLGDNTHSSKDSRLWTANVVRTKDGREFVAPDQARLTEDKVSYVFQPRPDGGVDLVDSYGIEHHLAKDEVESIRRNVNQPFARGTDLVGRAYLVFFPFPPFGDFRPRLLR